MGAWDRSHGRKLASTHSSRTEDRLRCTSSAEADKSSIQSWYAELGTFCATVDNKTEIGMCGATLAEGRIVFHSPITRLTREIEKKVTLRLPSRKGAVDT